MGPPGRLTTISDMVNYNVFVRCKCEDGRLDEK